MSIFLSERGSSPKNSLDVRYYISQYTWGHHNLQINLEIDIMLIFLHDLGDDLDSFVHPILIVTTELSMYNILIIYKVFMHFNDFEMLLFYNTIVGNTFPLIDPNFFLFVQLMTIISTIDDLNYPEKTTTYYIVNAPYIFSACWKVGLRLFCSF